MKKDTPTICTIVDISNTTITYKQTKSPPFYEVTIKLKLKIQSESPKAVATT